MIALHFEQGDSSSEKLLEQLNGLVISFKKIRYESEISQHPLPYIEEDGTIIKGEEKINKWLQQLRSDLEWQRSLSGDGCYIDPGSRKIC